MKTEPREDVKGNIARSMFYFYTIYPDGLDPDDWLLKEGVGTLNDNIKNPIEFIEFHVDYSKAKNLSGVKKRNYLHQIIDEIKNINKYIEENGIENIHVYQGDARG